MNGINLQNNIKIKDECKNYKNENQKKQSFGNCYMPQYAPMPVYTQIPYGINQRSYIKLGVDRLPNGNELHLYKLSNGQRVQILKTSKGQSAIITKVNVGALDETEFSKGISHFIEHSLFHGSKKYPAGLEKEIDKVATHNNASTTIKDTSYYMELADDTPEKIAQALDIHSDMLLNPTFSQIKKEKAIVSAEYERYLSDETSNNYQNTLMMTYPNQDKKTFLITGDNQSINAITEEEMFKYHQTFYQPHNMTTILATKNNPDEMIKIIADSFVEKSPKNQFPIKRNNLEIAKSTQRKDTISNEDTNGSYKISFPCESINKKEEIKLKALEKIVKTRFLEALRFESTHGSSGILSFCFLKSDEKRLSEAIGAINQIKKEIFFKPPTQNELEEIKKELNKDLKKRYNGSNYSQIESILNNSFENSNYVSFSQEEQLINNLSANDIIDSLKYLDPNRALYNVVHPRGTTQEEIIKKHNECIPLIQSLVVPYNLSTNNYTFTINSEQISGEKLYTTKLNNGSKLVIVDSNEDDKCQISWNLNASHDYSSKPALKYLLNNMITALGFKGSFYALQDAIEINSESDIDEIQETIEGLKSFNSFVYDKKTFEKAKEEALKEIESITNNSFALFQEMTCDKKYRENPEELKKELEKITMNDVINELNNIILNSTSTIVVKAPISKNPNLANQIANSFDSTNFYFKEFDSYKNPPKGKTLNCDCLVKADDLKQNKIAQIYQFKVSGNLKDEMTFELLARILSEKNFNQIREKDGLAYATNVQFVDLYGNGALYFETDSSCTNKGDINKIYNGYKKGINEVLSFNINDDELLLAKNKLKGGIASQFEDKTETLDYYLHEKCLNPTGIESLTQQKDIIDSITIEDIKKAANYIFANKPKYIISAKQNVIDENTEYINTLGKIEKR